MNQPGIEASSDRACPERRWCSGLLSLMTALAVSASGLSLTACGGEQRQAEGPAERAGERADEAADDASDAADEAADDAGDAAEEAGDEVEDATD